MLRIKPSNGLAAASVRAASHAEHADARGDAGEEGRQLMMKEGELAFAGAHSCSWYACCGGTHAVEQASSSSNVRWCGGGRISSARGSRVARRLARFDA